MSETPPTLNGDQIATIRKMIDEAHSREKLTAAQKWEVALIIGGFTVTAVAVMTFGGAPIVKEAARREASRQANDVYVDRLRQDEDFIEYIRGETSSIPRGTVLISDREDGCPTGWEAATELSGRVIVGVGPSNGDTSERRYRERGGQERVALTKPQMPAHTHGMEFHWSATANSPAGEGVQRLASVQEPANTVFETGNEGAGAAHENMPPFIALYFCKKVS